jgi:hypothetical protein
MQTIFSTLMPFLAALVGTGFLIMIFREALSAASGRTRGESLDEISKRLDPDYWQESEASPKQETPGILQTVDSTLTLSFVVVCLEALAYSVYLYVRNQSGQDLMGALRPDTSNLVCLAGLVLVGAAGLMRFREWRQ